MDKQNLLLKSKKTLSLIMVVVVIGFLGWKIMSDWETIAAFKWNFSFTDMLLFLLFLPLPFISNVLAWHLITLAQGEKISFSKNFEAWIFSNFTRYLPGGVWQYPSRIILLSKEGVTKESGINCLILEALFVVFTGLLIMLLTFVSGWLNLTSQDVLLLVITLLFVILVFLLMKSQNFANIVRRTFTFITGKNQNIDNIVMPFRWVPILVLGYFLAFLFPSIILMLLIKGAVLLTFNSLLLLLGAYAASWLLGYIAFFAPAGIGVREASLAGFLSLYMPFSVAAIVVIALRISLFISEAIGFGFAVLLKKIDSKHI